MRLFYFIARNFSYTFAVALTTVFVGWFGAVFGYYLGTSFLTVSDPFIITTFITWLFRAVLVVTFLHYVQFGMFHRLRIPSAMKPLRHINRFIHGNSIDESISTPDLKKLYVYISELPLYNTVSAVFYAALSSLLLLGAMYIDLKTGGRLEMETFRVMMRVTGIAVSVAWIIYGMGTYLVSEIITGRERALCYNELQNREIYVRPRSLVGIRFKFSLFVILMVLSLLTFAALIEKDRFSLQSGIVSISLYFVFSIVTGVFLMIVNSNSILRNLREMSRVSRAISAGAEVRFDVLSLDREFSEIEYGLLEMAREIDGHRKNLERMVEQRTLELQGALSDLKERDDLIQKQLDIASTIQRGILPGRIDDWNELRFAVRYLAMEKIGGDFYDFYQLKEDKLGLMVADVSGHGIPAALVTTMAKISFGNACAHYDSPRRIFQEVNQNILDHVKTQDYLTCFFVTVDDDYNIWYANASHQKAILHRRETGEIEMLDTNGLFIGAIEEARDVYEEKQAKLEYGDRLVLYTDGIPEAVDEKRREYSVERLQEVITKNAGLSLEDFTSSIIEDVQRFIGSRPVEDDITVLVIELARDEAVDIIKRSRKLVDENRYYEAIELLEKALGRYPDNTKLLYNLAKNHFRANNFAETVKNINRYTEADRKNKYAYYLGGAACYQMKDYKKAIEFLEEAIKLDPNFVNVHFALGMAYKKSGSVADAIRCFEKVVNLDVDHKMALYELKNLRNR